MGKIDRAKEYINMLKVYMGIIIALLISDISGTAKLFNAGVSGITFWLGIVSIMVLAYLFMRLAKYTHQKIDELEEIE
jgi:uncharacterized protein YacL